MRKARPERRVLLTIGASGNACADSHKGSDRRIARADAEHQRGAGDVERGGIGQTGVEAGAGLEGRYSDPSHALAYALGCTILRQTKRLWRSGDATKCRQRARAWVGSTGPNAEHTIAENAGVRSGRPRRQSRDCRAGRTREPTAFSGLGARLGRYCPRTDKHPIRHPHLTHPAFSEH